MVLVKVAAITMIFYNSSLAADLLQPQRDPFVPIVPSQETTGSSRGAGDKPLKSARFELRGTLKANDKSYANIDGKLIGVGDIHLGYELTFVGEGYIVLMNKGVELKLYLPNPHGDTDG